MGKISVIKELWEYMMSSKKWWLTPIIIILVLFGFILLLSEGSAVAPFIYTIF